jgi:bifunctional UDP-N-acetylglucosamine pyrophosphorylase/glucosamine-1-phosphate N-acetyltransferase
MTTRLVGLVLAAGTEARSRATSPKVLTPLLGKSMLRHVLEAVLGLKPAGVLVVAGADKDAVAAEAAPLGAHLAEQASPKESARAVLSARKAIAAQGGEDILVVPADMPLVRREALAALVARHRRRGNALTVMSAVLDNPSGYGRLVRTGEGDWKVVEERDASARVRAVREVHAGIYVFRVKDLLWALPRVSNRTRAGGYDLPETVSLLARSGRTVDVLANPCSEDVLHVRSGADLSRACDVLRLRKLLDLAKSGVTVLSPSSTWVDVTASAGPDTTLYPSVVIEGETVIGRRCRIYPGAHLRNARLGDDVHILTSTVVEDATLEDGVQAGPFARLRPKTVLRQGSRVGNFVELKNTDFGRGSKAMHLTYLGDSEVGEGANIGAGTITCNYDGRRKNRTVIEDGVFVGSGTELVAPLKVGRGAYIGAGSTVTKDVAADALAVARARQIEKPGWAKFRREKGRSA